jgi:hypothetical protein
MQKIIFLFLLAFPVWGQQAKPKSKPAITSETFALGARLSGSHFCDHIVRRINGTTK